MKLMNRITLVVLLLLAGACQKQVRVESAQSNNASRDQWWAGKSGVFAGKAAGTPFGDMGYAIIFRAEKGRVVAKTPPMPKGIGLPDGAYQKFTFYPDAGVLRMDLETLLTTNLAKRTLVEDSSRHKFDRWVLCDREQGCKYMEVILDWRTEGKLSWQTNMDGELHADFSLARQGDRAAQQAPR